MTSNRDPPSGAVALADSVSELLYGVAGWLLVLLGLALGVTSLRVLLEVGLTAGGVLGATVLFVLAFLTVAFGVFVNPRFRRRLDRRHAPSQFGRVRSVDQRVVRPEEECHERCVACRSRVDAGAVRRYREEFALAGVPIYTSSVGYNHYCLECATAEFLGSDLEAEPADDPSGRPSSDTQPTDSPARETNADERIRERDRSG
ncbi:hypothetical protein [Natrarchaeobaculum sulfurireducens]|uniref:DUF8108 domain-containing protein n=1 Tax=Natrarchaeobaculum sulfurireducens TaxID=2044521 RepID=A0A346PM62_9EURY|nr:hypothetical protein [Natrarchaeobaculum sulfurireducens]AXR76940.1 hypothetical protein AArc1_0596 [Natrarchaeobaculum sulfurireducens]AXR80607.1 hypothetical protein AArcMg_0584 [Natrarchaeobaculum sulfurireducens]